MKKRINVKYVKSEKCVQSWLNDLFKSMSLAHKGN